MKKCLRCSTQFAPTANSAGKYCSLICHWKQRKGKKRPPFTEEWKKNLSTAHKGQKGSMKGLKHSLISRQKMSATKRGLRLQEWDGFVRSRDKLERQRFQDTIQKLVFQRDNYACVLGGKEHGTNLQVDHIQSWKDYVELRFNIENCRTLCMKCHYQITFGKPMPPTVRAWGHNISKGGSNL